MARGRLQSRAGFTLIELLVVIAIIGVLASLLLPGLARAKAIAYSAKCKSNLRQMGIALSMYVGDSDGDYPFSITWDLAVQKHLGVKTSLIAPGANDFKCPTWNLIVPPMTRISSVNGVKAAAASYGYNGAGAGKPRSKSEPVGLGGVIGTGIVGVFDGIRYRLETGETPPPIPTREGQVKNPAEMIALGDGYCTRGPNRFAISSPTMGREVRLAWMEFEATDLAPERRHRGMLNMGFVDGHVQEAKIQKWFFSEAASDLRLWRVDNEAP